MQTYELHTQNTLNVCATMNYKFERGQLGSIGKYGLPYNPIPKLTYPLKGVNYTPVSYEITRRQSSSP